MRAQNKVIKIGGLWEEHVKYKITVVKEGACRANHHLGETFEFTWKTPAGISHLWVITPVVPFSAPICSKKNKDNLDV